MGLYVFNWPISVLGDWKGISIAHVIIIIKSEVFTFPIVIIFFPGCVPEMFVTSYSVTYCTYVPGKPGICFHYFCAVYDEYKYSDTFSYSFVCTVHFIIKLEVWTITHCLGLGHETMVSAVCLSIFLWPGLVWSGPKLTQVPCTELI